MPAPTTSTTAPTVNEYQAFLSRFDLSARVHQELKIRETTLSNHLVDLLITGANREFDLATVTNIRKYLPDDGICLAVGDGCSIPFNPPHYGAPWLTAFLTQQLPASRIISSDLVSDEPRFIFVTKGVELVMYGGRFLDCEVARFYHVRNGKVEEHFQADDSTYLRLMHRIGELEPWLDRCEPLIIDASKRTSLKLLLNASGYHEQVDELKMRIISGKDAGWEKAIYGVEAQADVDILNLQDFWEISAVTYLLARHLTPEVVEEVLENLPKLSEAIRPDCYVDISTVGNRNGQNGIFQFGIKGFPNSWQVFCKEVNLHS